MLILNPDTTNQFAWIKEIKQNVFCVRLFTLNITFIKFNPPIPCSYGLFTYFITMKLQIYRNIEDVYKIYYILIYKHIIICFHPTADGHLEGFQAWVIKYNAAINTLFKSFDAPMFETLLGIYTEV